MDTNMEEVLRRMRQEMDGAVAPLTLQLAQDPWRDQLLLGGIEHKVDHADGGAGGAAAPAGFPWGENYTFGITDVSSGGTSKLKVWKGKFRRWGDKTYNAADTEVTFSGDGDQYIVWKWSESGGLVIESTPQTNYPAESDSTYIYGAVHKVNLAGSTFTLLESIQTGIINAPIFTVPGA